MLQRRIASSAAACVLPLVLAACGGPPAPDPRVQPPLVRVGVVQDPAAATRSFTGTVAARVQGDLGFRVSGKVLERLVDTGQAVKRGQPLMRIDPNDLKLAAHAQQETVVAARARARQTAEDEARYRDLVGTGAVSASAYDQIRAAAESARAQLKAAEAQADVARNATGYAVLAADADGVVVETLADAGQVVNAGQVVVRVAHAGRREAVVHLPETLLPPVGSVGEATLYGNDTLTVPARLRQLSSAADRQTRTYEARYVLEGALAEAPLGATVILRIPEVRRAATQADLQVPIGAIFDPGKGPGVWVLNGKSNRVSWRPVKVRSLDDDAARVAGDLRAGDRIIALGAHLLREGEQVRIAAIGPRATQASGEGAQQ
ncbi:efflux RND transporter periplasmic adaptor subunit [Cupriavidus sp. IK-TO18]|uniref:efflux RND transporter periplasmic adaptor subunit n=1 Tax=unclassified Cupriavidus TaxID=2640874 RepID=UPI00189A2F25|nr:efflux RND transporter periplasmic adaptor subunit [Cupriavidus sp. IK-TO18]MBF6987567.1 efflux RND transporter periplasmic adaptor subunit [Cupriavidus sp. IK-TO18]